MTALNKFLANCQEIAELSVDINNKLINSFTSAQEQTGSNNIWQSYANSINSLFTQPQYLMQSQLEYSNKMWQLLQHQSLRFMGEDLPPMVKPAVIDYRFRSSAWDNNFYFDLVKQSYLLTRDYWLKMLQHLPDQSVKQMNQSTIAAKLMFDALSPTNVSFTNPDVMQSVFNDNADSLKNGLQRLSGDLDKFNNLLAIPNTNKQAFKVGENLAITPGSVVFRNDIMELIAYEPKKKCYEIPLLICPPWINKYYIFDLQQKNSMIKWLVDQGFQVLMISWRNAKKEHGEWCFTDYLKHGVFSAINFCQNQLDYKNVNLAGYCIGGTISSMALAYLNAKNNKAVNSATLMATLLDFTEAGEIGNYIDQEYYNQLQDKLDKDGYLDGGSMQIFFNLLRSNDLLWSHLVKQYLLNQDLKPFDLLFWSADNTRLPAKMHQYYLKNMYLENNLFKGKLKFDGINIDLSQIKTPILAMAAIADHIVPWQSAYNSVQKLPNCEFILSESGHVAGVMNHP
ncbi:MAG: alpha/beta fold hydrolase, partial [Pseudomonadota bacterium]